MCVHAVSTSLYKNMQLILPIGCRRAAFPIALLGATELSLERHAFREARRELGRAVSFNQPDAEAPVGAAAVSFFVLCLFWEGCCCLK